MRTRAASPSLSDVVFDGNSASGNGCAIYNLANLTGVGSPTLRGATFSANSANLGGAIYSSSGAQGAIANPTTVNATFRGNDAGGGSSVGGNGGAIYNDGVGGTSHVTRTNVTFSGNLATTVNHVGGAMVNVGAGAKPTVTNAIFWARERTRPAFRCGQARAKCPSWPRLATASAVQRCARDTAAAATSPQRPRGLRAG